MSKQKIVKLERCTLAYNRYSKDQNIKVQLLTFYENKELAHIWLPKAAMSEPYAKLMTIIKFRFRKEFGYTFNHHTYLTDNV